MVMDEQSEKNKDKLIFLIGRLWIHLGKKRQWQFFGTLSLMFLAGLAEMISIGAIVPFLAIITVPEKIANFPLAMNFANFFGAGYQPKSLLAIFMFAFAFAGLICGLVRLTLLWVNSRLAYSCGSDISFGIFEKTLYQPLSVHLSRNSSEVASGLDYKVSYTVNVLLQALNLTSSMIMLLAIMGALLLIDVKSTLIAGLSFAFLYLLISKVFHKQLSLNSKIISKQSSIVIKTVQEGLGGIREVLLNDLQSYFSEIYHAEDRKLKTAMGRNNFIGQGPRYLMESVGIFLLAAMTFFYSNQPGGVAMALPMLGALALGAQRLLPCLQQCYASWASIVGSKVALEETLIFLDQKILKLPYPKVSLLQFKQEMEIKELGFKYGVDQRWVLQGLSLKIPKGSSIGIIGVTGGGKSTLLDLLLGLLEPTEGCITIDGVQLQGGELSAWRHLIAHVPQEIYLADVSLAENIAFGIPRGDIDLERVRRVASQACLGDLIDSLDRGYNHRVGERGVRLSGGQRQRIGIARAMYRDAKVLVLDEATSALDGATEQEILPAIQGTHQELTIIMVAHRLSTLKNCSLIVEISGGKIINQGTYEELFSSSKK